MIHAKLVKLVEPVKTVELVETTELQQFYKLNKWKPIACKNQETKETI